MLTGTWVTAYIVFLNSYGLGDRRQQIRMSAWQTADGINKISGYESAFNSYKSVIKLLKPSGNYMYHLL
jgi:hypothetical protein